MTEIADSFGGLSYAAPSASAASDSFADRLGGEGAAVEAAVPIGVIALTKRTASSPASTRPTGLVPLALPSFALEEAAAWSHSFGAEEEVAPVEAATTSARAIEVPVDDGLRAVALPEFEDSGGATWLGAWEDDVEGLPEPGEAPSAPSRPAAPAAASRPAVAAAASRPAAAPGATPQATAARAPSAPAATHTQPPAAAPRSAPPRRSASASRPSAPSAPFGDDSIPCLGMGLKDIMKLPLNSGHGMVIAQIDGMTSVVEIEDIMAWFGPGRVRKLLDELILLGVAALKS